MNSPTSFMLAQIKVTLAPKGKKFYETGSLLKVAMVCMRARFQIDLKATKLTDFTMIHSFFMTSHRVKCTQALTRYFDDFFSRVSNLRW